MPNLIVSSSPITPARQQVIPCLTIWEALQAAKVDAQSLPVVVMRNGQPLLRAHWGIPVQDKDVIQVHILPAGGGGGGKNIWQMVAMLALTIVSFGAGTWIAGALEMTKYAGLFSALVFSAGALILNLFFRPQVGRTPTETLPSANNIATLRPSSNVARLLEPVPVVYGHFMLTPDLAAMPFSEWNWRGYYELNELFCLGAGRFQVHAINIDDTPITNFPEVNYDIVEPGEYPSQAWWWDSVHTAIEVTGQELKSLEQGYQWVGPFIIVPSGYTAWRMEYEVTFPNGLGYIDESITDPDVIETDGRLRNIEITVRAELREIDEDGNSVGDWFCAHEETLFQCSYNPLTFKFQIYMATALRYEMRVCCANYKVENNLNYLTKMLWTAARAYLVEQVDHGHVTTIACNMKATDSLSQASALAVKVLVTRKLQGLDANLNLTAEHATSSIAWALLDICRNPYYGANLPLANIDLATLYALHNTWECRDEGFNGVFDFRTTVWEALGTVARVGRAFPVLSGGLVTFVRISEQSIYKGMFTPRNIIKGSFQLDYKFYAPDSADSVTVQYVDGKSWKVAETNCTWDEDDDGTLPDRQEIMGITNLTQARREGIYLAKTMRLQRKFVTFQAELESLPGMLFPGDLIAVSHDLPQYGYSGEVIAINGTEITLSNWVTFGAGVYYVIFRRANGRVYGPYTCTPVPGDATETDVIECAEIATFADAEAEGCSRERTYYSVGLGEAYTGNFVVVSVIPTSDHMVSVMAVNDADVHDDVTPT